MGKRDRTSEVDAEKSGQERVKKLVLPVSALRIFNKLHG
jgi:hypothetical protein